MSRLVALVVLAVACRPAPTCEQVAEHATAIHPLASYSRMVERCTNKRWSPGTRACTVAAATPTEFVACSGASLSLDPPPPVDAYDWTTHPKLVIVMRADGSTLVDGTRIEAPDLDRRLAATDGNTRIVLEADPATPVQPINEFVRRVRAAGFEHIAFSVPAQNRTHTMYLGHD